MHTHLPITTPLTHLPDEPRKNISPPVASTRRISHVSRLGIIYTVPRIVSTVWQRENGPTSGDFITLARRGGL